MTLRKVLWNLMKGEEDREGGKESASAKNKLDMDVEHGATPHPPCARKRMFLHGASPTKAKQK